MVSGQNDWIIQDSEEEDQLGSSQLDDRRPVSPILPEAYISSINAFTSITAEKTSHISSLETDPAAPTTISSFPPPPRAEISIISESSSKRGSRPRPRPIFNRAGVDPAAVNTSTSDPILSHTPTFNHSEQRTVAAHSDPTGIINTSEVTAPALDIFSQDIAERAKMRARKAAKQSTQYTEDAIDITDDDLPITPAKKPRERPKPRRVKRVNPARDNPQPPSDPLIVPAPSSSPLLPASDPFPTSVAVNSTPSRPDTLDEPSVPSSPLQGSQVDRRKRKRPNRLQTPTDGLANLNRSPTAQARMASPPPNPPLPPTGGPYDATNMDLHENLNSLENDVEDEYFVKKSSKKPKGSKAAESSDDIVSPRPERRGTGKPRRKSVVEVVILSPRKKTGKKIKAGRMDGSDLDNNVHESRNDSLAVSSFPVGRPAQPVEDEDAYKSPQQTSDGDDELILAPKRKPTRTRNGKRKTQDEDNNNMVDIGSSCKQVTAGEVQEESKRDRHQTELASTSPTNDRHLTCGNRPVEPKTPVPLKVNIQPNTSVQGDDPPKLSPTRETVAPKKLRYTLSKLDNKTPMRELIKRAASHPSAPFSVSSSPIASPLAKTAKSALRRIAPLHINRRTPPPPPPWPPPPKKSKKMLEMEEKWEMELEDEVEGWWALTDEERQDWRRAKRDKELGCVD